MTAKAHIAILPVLLLVLCVGFATPGAMAQQPQDCNSCGCIVPSMLGVTYTTSLTHGACGDSTYTMNVGR
jgi:hypothetical protein